MLYFSPKNLIVSSKSLNSKAIPKEIIIEGTIKLETVIRNKKLEPKNFFLNAIPADNDSNTVNIIKINPKNIDLLKAEPIST